MPTTYEDLYDKDGTIYKKGVDGGLDTPYADPEQLGSDLGIGSDQIDWGAIAPYAPPQDIPQDVPQNAGATAEDILGGDAYGDEIAGAEADYYNTLTPEYGQETTAQAEADVMKKFQQEIDALEAEKAAARGRIVEQYGQIGEERAGTSTAIQARRGLVGSTFGEQQKRGVQTQTQREQDEAIAYSSAIYAQRKSDLMGTVRTSQADEAKLRLEAAQKGSAAKLDEIKGRKARQDERVNIAIKNMLGMEADIEDPELLTELSTELGISERDLKGRYETMKSEAEEALRIKEEEQFDKELKRNYTQAQIDKMEADREMIEKKFQQDQYEYGMDYALEEKELAIKEYNATKPQSYSPSSARKLYGELGGETGTGKSFNEWYESEKGGGGDIVEWSEEAEAAGVVGRPQEEVDEIMNNPTAPTWFNDQASGLYGMSKDNWQTEWDEIRNPILDAFRKTEKDWGEYTDTEMRKLREAGLSDASTAKKDAYLYGKKEKEGISFTTKEGFTVNIPS